MGLLFVPNNPTTRRRRPLLAVPAVINEKYKRPLQLFIIISQQKDKSLIHISSTIINTNMSQQKDIKDTSSAQRKRCKTIIATTVPLPISIRATATTATATAIATLGSSSSTNTEKKNASRQHHHQQHLPKKDNVDHSNNPNYQHLLVLLSNRYPVLRNVKVIIDPDTDAYFGYIVTEKVSDYIYTSNKSRYREVIPKVIHVTRNDNDKLITFLHEVTHGITPMVERKVRNEWVEVVHGREFHDNFLQLCNYCCELRILPKPMTEKELRMRDSVNKYRHGL